MCSSPPGVQYDVGWRNQKGRVADLHKAFNLLSQEGFRHDPVSTELAAKLNEGEEIMPLLSPSPRDRHIFYTGHIQK